MSHRNPGVLGVWGDDGTRVIASEAKWKEPPKWDRKACEAGVRRRVFCASIADVFEDRPELVAPRERLWGLIRRTPNLDWLLLTKRPENWRRLWPLEPVPGHVSQNEGDGKRWERFANVWLGTSVENQAAADERIPHLLNVPASVRFLSCEPLLGPVDLRRVQHDGTVEIDALTGDHGVTRPLKGRSDAKIHWVIVGGESGPKARPMHPDWARSLRDQCLEAGVPYHHKQNGEWLADGQARPCLADAIGGRGSHVSRALFPDGSHLPDLTGRGTNGDGAIVVRKVGKKASGRLLDGVTWDQFPEVGRA